MSDHPQDMTIEDFRPFCRTRTGFFIASCFGILIVIPVVFCKVLVEYFKAIYAAYDEIKMRWQVLNILLSEKKPPKIIVGDPKPRERE